MNEISIQKLYYRYKRRSDDDIRKYLEKIAIVRKEHKGEGTVYGYRALSKEAMDKILEKPRNISLTFDATESDSKVMEGLKEYKTIVFLVKSSSRFFLKPDIGEVFDQIDYDDLYGGIKAIYVKDNHELLSDTEGEHFLMEAVLLK
jgi:hypothetical protein